MVGIIMGILGGVVMEGVEEVAEVMGEAAVAEAVKDEVGRFKE